MHVHRRLLAAAEPATVMADMLWAHQQGFEELLAGLKVRGRVGQCAGGCRGGHTPTKTYGAWRTSFRILIHFMFKSNIYVDIKVKYYLFIYIINIYFYQYVFDNASNLSYFSFPPCVVRRTGICATSLRCWRLLETVYDSSWLRRPVSCTTCTALRCGKLTAGGERWCCRLPAADDESIAGHNL